VNAGSRTGHREVERAHVWLLSSASGLFPYRVVCLANPQPTRRHSPKSRVASAGPPTTGQADRSRRRVKRVPPPHGAADRDRTNVVEGNHYFPLESVTASALIDAHTRTTCPRKGQASYYAIKVDVRGGGA